MPGKLHSSRPQNRFQISFHQRRGVDAELVAGFEFEPFAFEVLHVEENGQGAAGALQDLGDGVDLLGFVIAQVEKLERLIQEEVPPGCGRATSEMWFDRHAIRYSWIVDTTGDRYGNRTMPELVGLRCDDLGGMLRGEIYGPEANVDWLYTGRIHVYFFFDKQDRLVGHLVDPFVFAP
jgi:hypothetical protein